MGLKNKISDAELLEILDKSQVSDSPADNISLFINTFGLQEGSLKIPLKLVYRLYKLWNPSGLDQPSFDSQITLLMPKYEVLPNDTILLLDKSTLKINEEVYKLIKDKRIPKERWDYFKKHFESFLKSCNIQKGSDWILVSELRTIYLSFIKNKYKKNPIGIKNFDGFCKLFLDTRGNPLEVAVNKKVISASEKKVTPP